MPASSRSGGADVALRELGAGLRRAARTGRAAPPPHSNGPSGSGRSANVRSSSPCSSRRRRSAASVSSRTLHLDARPFLLEAAQQARGGCARRRSGRCRRAAGPRRPRRARPCRRARRRAGRRSRRRGGAGGGPASVEVDGPRAAGPVDELLADDCARAARSAGSPPTACSRARGRRAPNERVRPTASRAARWRSSTPEPTLRSIIDMNYNPICANSGALGTLKA